MSTGFCALKDHFKKVDENPTCQSIRNIDFIYMINLDQRPEKWESAIAQLIPYGIEPYRFSAVNGWELTLQDINDVGVVYEPGMEYNRLATSYHLHENFQPSHEEMNNYGQVYFAHCMSLGAIGCALSHLSILQDAYDKGYKTIWVLEDDIEVIQDPRQISEIIEQLDQLVGMKNWDILFTDQDTRNAEGKYVPRTGYRKRPDFDPKDKSKAKKRKEVGQFRKVGGRFGTYSMILRRSGIKKILNFYKTHNIFLPYDFEFSMPDDIEIFTVKNDVVRHRINAQSDNGGANYKNEK